MLYCIPCLSPNFIKKFTKYEYIKIHIIHKEISADIYDTYNYIRYLGFENSTVKFILRLPSSKTKQVLMKGREQDALKI